MEDKILVVRPSVKFQLKKVLCMGGAVANVEWTADQVYCNWSPVPNCWFPIEGELEQREAPAFQEYHGHVSPKIYHWKYFANCQVFLSYSCFS